MGPAVLEVGDLALGTEKGGFSVTHLRKIMLEELERRNYAQTTIDCYIHTVEHFSRYFHRSPDQLGPQHIREYQAALFKSGSWRRIWFHNVPSNTARTLSSARSSYSSGFA